MRFIFTFSVSTLSLFAAASFWAPLAWASASVKTASLTIPSHEWMITTGLDQTCSLSNQYKNGYRLSLLNPISEPDNFMFQFDIGKPVFTKGNQYKVQVTASGNGYTNIMTGRAVTPSTLSFSMTPSDDFITALQSQGVLYLKASRTQIPFSLAGIRAGMEKLAKCRAQGGLSSPDGFNAIMPAAGAKAEVVKGRKVLNQQIKAMDEMESVTIDEHTTTPQVLAPIWTAQRGEIVKDVLQRWAAKEGVAFKWESEQNARLSANFQSSDSFEGAVSALLTVSGVTANSGIVEQLPDTAMNAIQPAAGKNSDNGLQWQTFEGAYLRDTLVGWSAQAGVDLVWQTDHDFIITDNRVYSGDFHEALQSLLEDEGDRFARPVAQLFKGGQRPVLVIEAEHLG